MQNAASKNTNQTQTHQTTSNRTTHTSDFNLAALNRIITRHRLISDGAKTLAIEMISMSGRKGFCEVLIQTWCHYLNRSRAQVKRYIRELQDHRIIKVHTRPKRSSIYQILIIPGQSAVNGSCMRHIEYGFKRKRIIDQENVISLHRPEQPQTPDPGPPPDEQTAPALVQTDHQEQEQNQDYNCKVETQTSKPPVNHYLLRQIIQLTGDKKSFPFWFKVVKRVDEQTIYSAVSSLRIANDCNQVQHRGRYLVGILKQLAPELFQEQTQTRQAPIPKQTRPQVQAIGPDQEETTPTVERNQQLNMEQVRNIRALLNSKTPPPTRPKTHMSRIMHQDALNRLKFQSYGPGKVSVGGKGKVVQIAENSLTLDVSEEIPLVSPTSRARTDEILYHCTDQIPPPPRGEQ